MGRTHAEGGDVLSQGEAGRGEEGEEGEEGS